MSHKSQGAEKLFRRAAAFCISAAVSLLSGCSLYEDFMPGEAELPTVTDYVSEAKAARGSNQENQSTSAVTTVASSEDSSSDSQTVSEGDAASGQAETEAQTAVAAEESAVPETVITETTLPVSETTAVSSVSEPTAETTVSVQTIQLETECSVPAAQSPVALEEPDDSYDSEFFSSDLFIGDSISTGYSLYGFLKDKNVFAKVGLNPSTVLTKAVSTCYGEIGISSMMSNTIPDHAYIMLGSNGIQWLSVSNMLQSTDTLVNLITDISPDTKVVIISVPPVTPKYDNTVEDLDVMAKINEYNADLNEYCSANDMLFVDIASVLKDSTGYFNTKYAESDGMHFKASAYRVVLSKIQSEVKAFDEAHIPAETEITETTEAAEETSVSEAQTVSETAEETAAETFMTVPAATESVKDGKRKK